MHTIAFCERDEFCRAVLRKHWPDVPCFTDVHRIDADGLGRLGRIDLVCGGPPCQPVSQAGLRRGEKDDRYLWSQMLRVIALARPAWVVAENVVGFITLGLDDVLTELESMQYAPRALVIPACAAGAPHRRDRVWIVAHTEWNEQPRQEPCDGSLGRMGGEYEPFPWHRDWEVALRQFRGMDDGISYGVERVDTLRNAVVPQIPEIIGRAIISATTSI